MSTGSCRFHYANWTLKCLEESPSRCRSCGGGVRGGRGCDGEPSTSGQEPRNKRTCSLGHRDQSATLDDAGRDVWKRFEGQRFPSGRIHDPSKAISRVAARTPRGSGSCLSGLLDGRRSLGSRLPRARARRPTRRCGSPTGAYRLRRQRRSQASGSSPTQTPDCDDRNGVARSGALGR